ncbi:MAG: hypothetical protein PVG45_10655 [Gammaproteobacteria bacterium]
MSDHYFDHHFQRFLSILMSAQASIYPFHERDACAGRHTAS